MLNYPIIDPVIFSIGPLQLRWYGLMYLLGFLAVYILGKRRCKYPWSPLRVAQIEDLVFYGALGAIIGGRIGYVFFYGYDYFLTDPMWLFRIWEGGMAFHGGFLGVIFSLYIYSKKIKKPFSSLCDFIVPLTPIGLGLGRLANFINGELFGRTTDVPWSMIFPSDPLSQQRHPSQLYQFFFEGVVLFVLLYSLSRRKRSPWFISSLFLIGYGLIRFFVEFYREPDSSLFFDWMTKGQFLSLPMILIGVLMLIYSFNKSKYRI